MKRSIAQNYNRLDIFKIAAAFLVVAIHTSPLASFNDGADFFLTRLLARLAVPFFFMVTGQFVLEDYAAGERKDFFQIRLYLKKIFILYACAVLIYIPAGMYAGHYTNLSFLSLLRMLFSEGTFYHLWYFPALIWGVLLLCLFIRFCSPRTCTIITAVLYILGLLGDSYWGLTRGIPGVAWMYERGFEIFSYTRNGLFFAPLFLWMGARRQSIQHVLRENYVTNVIFLACSFLLMTAEGFILRSYGWQRHDSMYLMLPFCMLFLYILLLCEKNGPESSSWLPRLDKKTSKYLRTISTYIYLLHPLIIIVVRGIAKTLHASWLLVDNSLIHYLLVCLGSTAAAVALTFVIHWFQRKPFEKARAWIELDRDALQYNAEALCSLLPEGCVFMPAVKADAYGHGLLPVARMLNEMGIYSFCVACISEGIKLRKNGIQGDILILGFTHPRDFGLLRRYRLTQTVIDYAYARSLNRYKKPLHVHVKIDTGMHRLGQQSGDIEKLCRIFAMKNLIIEGAFTHLCMDDTNEPAGQKFTYHQARLFFEVIEEIQRQGYSCPKLHLLSSYGVLNYPELGGDYARTGIALYGVQSCETDYNRTKLGLQPVLSLHARIASIHRLLPGESAGYGLAFTAKCPATIAALTIGYADGLPRSLSCGRGFVLINGQRAPIVGYICMDQTLVDITHIPQARPGDIVTLIGRQGNESISVYDLARSSETITNEILSRLGERLTRIIA